jgi:hypothetical protein
MLRPTPKRGHETFDGVVPIFEKRTEIGSRANYGRLLPRMSPRKFAPLTWRADQARAARLGGAASELVGAMLAFRFVRRD